MMSETARKSRTVGLPTLLMPDYMQRFACIQGACEDSCCGAGWTVTMDRAGVQRLAAAPAPAALETLIRTGITPHPSPTSEREYAVVKSGDAACAFMTPEGLCAIHRDLGEHHLPATCRAYPRQVLDIGKARIEIAASVSCPEAARRVLLNPHGIRFVETPADRQVMQSIPPAHPLPRESIGHVLWDIRDFAIRMLRNRDLRVWERLLALGMFFAKAASLHAAGDNPGIREAMENAGRRAGDPVLRDNLRQIPARPAVQLALVKKLTEENLGFKTVCPGFVRLVGQSFAGMGIGRAARSPEQPADGYIAAYDGVYRPYMASREYLLENYLVNHAFMNLIPGRHADLYAYYVHMALFFGMIKTHLIGLSGHHGRAFDQSHVVALVCAFSRNVEQHPDYVRQLYTVLKSQGLTGMATMSILLKN